MNIDNIQKIAKIKGITISELFKENKIEYIIYPSTEEVENESYPTYGIAAMMDNVIVDYIPDVTPDFDTISKLVEKCNAEELALEHMRDVSEDAYMESI